MLSSSLLQIMRCRLLTLLGCWVLKIDTPHNRIIHTSLKKYFVTLTGPVLKNKDITAEFMSFSRLLNVSVQYWRTRLPLNCFKQAKKTKKLLSFTMIAEELNGTECNINTVDD